MDEVGTAWFDGELAGCRLADERLNKRLRKLLEQIGGAVGQSIPLSCQDWANTKAAYRFFSNERVSKADILAGHFQSTRERLLATDGMVFVLHDTTEFYVSKGGNRSDRYHQKQQQLERLGGSAAIANGLRHPDALQPRFDG